MRGINKVILVGNIGKDPVIHYIDGNVPVAKFPLATTETRKDKTGNMVSETEWHTIVLWRGLAKLAEQYLKKGSLVYLEGKLHTRSWEDKNNNFRSQTEIIGDNLVMLDKKKDHDLLECRDVDLKVPSEDCEHEESKNKEEINNGPDGDLSY